MDISGFALLVIFSGGLKSTSVPKNFSLRGEEYFVLPPNSVVFNLSNAVTI